MYTATARHSKPLPLTNPYTLITVFFLALATGYVLINFPDDKTGFYALYLLALIQFMPFAVCYTRRHFNYLAFILLNHLVCMSLGRFNKTVNLGGMQAFPADTIAAIHEQILCTLIIIIAYHLCRYFFFFRFVAKEKYQLISLAPQPFLILTAYVFLFPVLTAYLPPSWLALHFISVNADLVMLLTSQCPKMPRLTMHAKMGSLVICFIYFLKFGSLGMMLNYLGLMFISSCLRRDYFTILVCIGVMVAGLMVQTVKGDFRTVIYSNRDLGITERAAVLGELISASVYMTDPIVEDEEVPVAEDEEAVSNSESAGIGKTLLRAFDRVNDESLERVLAMTPSRVPFWDGESYSSIPYMFIPRPLWPDKPSRHFWNKFGRVYGYLHSEDFQTSIAVSFLAEGYMNYGYAGMYGAAVFFGILVALVERLGYYISGGYFYFSYIVFLMPLLHYSSDMGSMLQALIIFSIVMFVLRNQVQKVARKDEYSET